MGPSALSRRRKHGNGARPFASAGRHIRLRGAGFRSESQSKAVASFSTPPLGPTRLWVIALVERFHGLSRRGWSDLASHVALLDSHEGVEGLRLAIRSSKRAHASVHALQAQRWVEDEVNKLGSKHPDRTFRVHAVGARIEPTLLRRRLAEAVGRVGAALIVIDEMAPVDSAELYVTLADPLPFDDLTVAGNLPGHSPLTFQSTQIGGYPGAVAGHGRACSHSSANCRSVSSARRRPVIWIPIGTPLSKRPAGSEIAG